MSRTITLIIHPAMRKGDLTSLVLDYPQDDYLRLETALRNFPDLYDLLAPFALAHLEAINDEDDDAAAMYDDFVTEQFRRIADRRGDELWNAAVARIDRTPYAADLADQVYRNGPVAYLLALAEAIEESGINELKPEMQADTAIRLLNNIARWAICRFQQD
jgi:hypothetical protein